MKIPLGNSINFILFYSILFYSSILGPLLLLVYINGIQSVLKHSRMTMFANDMAFYRHENSPTDL